MWTSAWNGFQQIKPCQTQFVRRVRKIYQQIDEQNLETQFEFMSEQDMIDAGIPETLVLWCICFCFLSVL